MTSTIKRREPFKMIVVANHTPMWHLAMINPDSEMASRLYIQGDRHLCISMCGVREPKVVLFLICCVSAPTFNRILLITMSVAAWIGSRFVTKAA